MADIGAAYEKMDSHSSLPTKVSLGRVGWDVSCKFK